MKHILFVLDYFTPHRGGSETVFENIISRLLKKNYRVTVLTSHFDQRLAKHQKDGHLDIWRTGTGRISFMRKALGTGRKILKEYRDISVVHTSTYGGAIPASILGVWHGKKIVLTVHEVFSKLWDVFKPRPLNWLYKMFERKIFLFPYHVYHCVSLYTLNSLRIRYGISDKRLRLIYNGVDYDFWNPKHVSEKTKLERKEAYHWEENYLLLYYGHSGMSKGIDFLIDAIPEIVKKNPDAILIFNLIHAKRDLKIQNKIKKKAKESGHPEQVKIFHGWEKEKLRELVACVDVVIAPSLAEGFGSVHTESLAMGKTLITTQVAAIPEVVGGNVKFIQPQSSEAIVRGIEEVRKGKIEVFPPKVFDWEKTVKEVEKLYEI